MSNPESDVADAYLSELGCPADPGGLATYIQYLVNGSLSVVWSSLATSAEAEADLSNLYQTILGRAPDPVGLAGDTQYLANGGSLANVRLSIASSEEAKTDVEGFYQFELGRVADAGGLASCRQVLSDADSLSNVRAAVAASAEAQTDLTGFYQSFLGRTADAGGSRRGHRTWRMVLDCRHSDSVRHLPGGNGRRHRGLSTRVGPRSECGRGRRRAIRAAVGYYDVGLAGRARQTVGQADPALRRLPRRDAKNRRRLKPNFVYDILNDDALIASQKQVVNPLFSGIGDGAVIGDFNVATDILQVQSRQVASFADLQPFQQNGQFAVVWMGKAQLFLDGYRLPRCTHPVSGLYEQSRRLLAPRMRRGSGQRRRE